jgi:hypothetical protein
MHGGGSVTWDGGVSVTCGRWEWNCPVWPFHGVGPTMTLGPPASAAPSGVAINANPASRLRIPIVFPCFIASSFPAIFTGSPRTLRSARDLGRGLLDIDHLF